MRTNFRKACDFLKLSFYPPINFYDALCMQELGFSLEIRRQ